jgi:hypothetical protein
MKSPLPGNRTTVALLALCGLVMLIVLAEAVLHNPAVIAVDADKGDTSLVLPENPEALFAPRPFADFSEVLERPLLFADRRMPPEPEDAAITARPLSPLRLKLEGVAISAESRVALLRNTSNNQLLQLTEGMSHDGWTLEKISSSSARFRRGEDTSDLLLDTSPN